MTQERLLADKFGDRQMGIPNHTDDPVTGVGSHHDLKSRSGVSHLLDFWKAA